MTRKTPAPFEVYWNLHQHRFSLRNRITSRVESHETEVYLRDVSFSVGLKGRERVLKEKRKNVHAFVRGRKSDYTRWACAIDQDGRDMQSHAISYDPYKAPFFYDCATRQEVLSASHIWCFSKSYTTNINGLLHDVPRPVLFAKGLVYGDRFVEGYAK